MEQILNTFTWKCSVLPFCNAELVSFEKIIKIHKEICDNILNSIRKKDLKGNI